MESGDLGVTPGLSSSGSDLQKELSREFQINAKTGIV